MTINLTSKTIPKSEWFVKENILIAEWFFMCYKAAMKLLTTQEAAEQLGVSVRRVTELITSGRLPAERFGRAYMINDSDLKFVEDRKPGRPPKAEKEKTAKKSQTRRKASASLNDHTKEKRA